MRTRAAVSATTSAAPASISAAPHAPSVAPVVKTSSTSNTLFPETIRPAARKAPADSTARASRPAPIRRFAPARTRARAFASTGRPIRPASALAMTSAWLWPRSAYRSGCNGTGTTASASRRHSESRHISASNSPSLAETRGRRFTSSSVTRNAPAYSPTDRDAAIGSGAQVRHRPVPGSPHRSQSIRPA